MGTQFLPPPTFANPVIPGANGQSQFNPIWLDWFLNLVAYVSGSTVGQLKNVIPVTGSGYWPIPNGVNNALVWAMGAGGQGGYAAAANPGDYTVGAGGNAGSLVWSLVSLSGITQAEIIVGQPTAGGAVPIYGSDSTFTAGSTVITAPAGAPGGVQSGSALPLIARAGANAASSGGYVNGSGALGEAGIIFAANGIKAGDGASSMFGTGGAGASRDSNGIAGALKAAGLGAGGGGGFSYNVGGTVTNSGPSAGAPGFVVVQAYS